MSSVRALASSLVLILPSMLLASPVGGYQAPPSFLFSWGSAGSGPGQFAGPAGIAIDSHGDVYVADQANYRICKFSSSGAFILQWGSYGLGSGQFQHPYGLAIDGLDDVYVVDVLTARVQVFTSDGAFLRELDTSGAGALHSPRDAAVRTGASVLVTDHDHSRIARFRIDGSFNGSLANVPAPTGIDVTPTGDVFVSSEQPGGFGLYRFDLTGAFILAWGANGELNGPGGLGADAFGRLFVADHGNDRVQCFSTSGDLLTLWGSYGWANGQFIGPLDLAVSKDGLIYVSDTGNDRIQVFGASVVDAVPTSWGRLKVLFR